MSKKFTKKHKRSKKLLKNNKTGKKFNKYKCKSNKFNRRKKKINLGGGLSGEIRKNVNILKSMKIKPINIVAGVKPCMEEIKQELLRIGFSYPKLSQLDLSTVSGSLIYMYVVRKSDGEIYYDGARYSIPGEGNSLQSALIGNLIINDLRNRITHDCLGIGELIIGAGDIYINTSKSIIIVDNNSGHYHPPKESLINTCACLRELFPHFAIYYKIITRGEIPPKSNIEFTGEIKVLLESCNCNQTVFMAIDGRQLEKEDKLSHEVLIQKELYRPENLSDLLHMCDITRHEQELREIGIDTLEMIQFAYSEDLINLEYFSFMGEVEISRLKDTIFKIFYS